MSQLYVVATPIGNLEDITQRALRILGEVDAVACEDTRRTLKLLSRYQLRKPLVSFHSHNQERAAEQILRLLEEGKNVALVSDGGTPGLSDPGGTLVRAARERGHLVVPVPGPSAFAALVSAAGCPSTGLLFAGFLPPKTGKRRKWLAEHLAWEGGIVLYESPHRILRLLEELKELAPQRKLLIGREMTKAHEEFLEGIPEKLLTELSGRARMLGEFSVLVMPEKKF